MSEKRKMFPELLGDLNSLPDELLLDAVEEIVSGLTCFGPFEEWLEWYDYLLPHLVAREWQPAVIYQPIETCITAFMARYPDADRLPDRRFRDDALRTLGLYIMSPRFWPEGHFRAFECLSKWAGPTGVRDWPHAGNLLSGSLLFCIKYLEHAEIEPWFRSVLAVPDPVWTIQIVTWLVGAHPLLSGAVNNPAELPEEARFRIDWNWSHALQGAYSGHEEEPIERIPLLSGPNKALVLELARAWDIGEFLESAFNDPGSEWITWELVGLPQAYEELYG